jgi:hypothetical protein
LLLEPLLLHSVSSAGGGDESRDGKQPAKQQDSQIPPFVIEYFIHIGRRMNSPN